MKWPCCSFYFAQIIEAMRGKNIPTFLLHGHQVGGSLSRDDLGVRVETGLRTVRGELAVGGEGGHLY